MNKIDQGYWGGERWYCWLMFGHFWDWLTQIVLEKSHTTHHYNVIKQHIFCSMQNTAENKYKVTERSIIRNLSNYVEWKWTIVCDIICKTY